ncbi:aldo/keto reductase [Novosphingobium sp.]|uniref:aldo/keto reductase n=1 Tax=Novosphingobium sp. TaxID=1874826 RepID=UPI002736B974|nr:aldo/keto reductase [Novosphingobium sp.]MDP3908596.1 aldo/keto reductase [Novosphingobium sp.]
MKLLPRLVYGCGRLTGGASKRDALALLDRIFDAGVLALDVAPTYGIGTAEEVVGEAVGRRKQGARIEIIAKVGIAPPRYPWLKTALRRAKRTFAPTSPRDLTAWRPIEPAGRFGTGDYSAEAMTASVNRSAARLPHIDKLLLHGCGPDECTVEVCDSLEKLAAEHSAQPGYAIGSRFDAALDARYPKHFFAETAINPDIFVETAISSDRKDVLFHSLMPTAAYLTAHNSEFAAALDRAAEVFEQIDIATARISAFYALAAVREPEARLVFAANDPVRLANLLKTFHQIDTLNLSPTIVERFGR